MHAGEPRRKRKYCICNSYVCLVGQTLVIDASKNHPLLNGYKCSNTVGGRRDKSLTDVGKNKVVPTLGSLFSLLPLGIMNMESCRSTL